MQCQRCEGTGVCPTCRGTGRSGYFLLQPPSWTPKCCAAMEMQAAQFAKARVRCLTTIPGSLSLLPCPDLRPSRWQRSRGPTWRFLSIPRLILMRSHDQQRGWVSWRVRTHYKLENGQCLLFGAITGYRWHFAPGQSTEFDIRGRTRTPTPSREGFARLEYKKRLIRSVIVEN
jgi:hypothetical protein